MGKYIFKTTPVIEKFCDAIVGQLLNKFGISDSEAMGRVNDMWSHVEKFDGKDDIIFHLLAEEWADIIYYGPDITWCEKTKRELIPLPYPDPDAKNN